MPEREVEDYCKVKLAFVTQSICKANISKKRAGCRDCVSPVGLPMRKIATPTEVCAEDGCEAWARVKGRCRIHYNRHRVRENQRDDVNRPEELQCSFKECTRGRKAFGFCAVHYDRIQRMKAEHKITKLREVNPELTELMDFLLMCESLGIGAEVQVSCDDTVFSLDELSKKGAA